MEDSVFSQFRSFRQCLRGYGYFPDVSGIETCHPVILDFIKGSAHLRGNGAGKTRNSLLVTRRVRIPCFRCRAQDLNSCANRFLEAVKGLVKLFLGMLPNSDVFYESFQIESFSLFILCRAGIYDGPNVLPSFL